MEMPHLGKHCPEETCKKLDFLPMNCDACNQSFCFEHFNYANHNCQSAYKKNIQVPVCPLCNAPVPGIRGQSPDITVGAHIDNDCQADPAKSRRKVFTNRCSMKGCRIKEVVPVLCSECSLNYCLKHRHPTDHRCERKPSVANRNGAVGGWAQRNNSTSFTSIQGSMDEDEALAKALALSMQMQNEPTNSMKQEDLDAALARQLQQQEQQTQGGRTRGRDRCQLS